MIAEMKPPTNLKGIQRFLEVTGYYRRFIEGFPKIETLTRLLKKVNAYLWTNECQEAFVILKEKLMLQMKSIHEMCHRLERWKLKLMHLNMKIKYKPESTNYEANLFLKLENGRVCLIQEEKPRQNGRIYKTNELTIEKEQIFFLK